MPGAAAFFDLDKTIIATSSTLAFGRQFYASGLISRRAMVKSAYAQFVYMLGGADDEQMARMRDELTTMVRGWSAQQVRDIVDEALVELIDPLIYDEAVALIEEHHAAGRDVVIVSSSGEEVVAPIADLVGADCVVATRMRVVDGRYTGEIDFYAAGGFKAEAVRDLAVRRGYDLATSYAYSDSVSDVPMLEEVGFPHAVNPDRALRKVAAERGWPVLAFRHPVPLSARLGRLRPRPVPLAAAALAAFVTVVVVAGRRRQRHRPVTGLGLARLSRAGIQLR